MKKVTILILTVVNIVYVILGGVMFVHIESSQDTTQTETYHDVTRAFLANNTCVCEADLEDLARRLMQLYKEGMSIGNLTKYRPTWDYSSGIFFTITGVTTIGYGHLTPTSVLGQTVCIIYLLIGIPLMAIYLAGIGGNVSQFIKATMDRQIWVKQHSTVDIVVKMVTVNVLILSLLILLPAIVFTYVEKWTYGESVYYAFITLTTVGFGDFYLGQNTHSEYGVMYKLLTAAWIVVGLAVIATIISEILAVVSPDVHKSEVENTSKISVLPEDGANETQNSQE